MGKMDGLISVRKVVLSSEGGGDFIEIAYFTAFFIVRYL